MLAPAGGLPEGWRLDGIDGSDVDIRARYARDAGRWRVDVLLRHPAVADSVYRTDQFALVPNASAPVPAVLIERLLGSIREHEGSFRWQDPVAELALDELLEVDPYIDLGISFDHEACFAEAWALRDEFVVYTSNQYKPRGWRGLALRSPGGDPKKVVTPEAPDSSYTLTPVAERCPQTLSVLRQVLDLERGAAVSFLMLEGHSRITPHSDDTTHETLRSINIALNVPTGCEFFVETNRDGSSNRYTRCVPFQPGRAFMINVARYHTVVNPAEQPRIHVVARCPARLPASQLLEIGLRQHDYEDVQAMRRALARKYEEQKVPVRLDAGTDRYERKRRSDPAAVT